MVNGNSQLIIKIHLSKELMKKVLQCKIAYPYERKQTEKTKKKQEKKYFS